MRLARGRPCSIWTRPSATTHSVLGAADFVAEPDSETLTLLAGSLDLIICTVPANLNLDTYLGLLDLSGTFVILGLPSKELTVDALSLIINQRALAGSRIGNLAETQDMLNFCAEHGVAAEVEVIGADDIDEAYQRLKAGQVRFRFVLDVSTIARRAPRPIASSAVIR